MDDNDFYTIILFMILRESISMLTQLKIIYFDD